MQARHGEIDVVTTAVVKHSAAMEGAASGAGGDGIGSDVSINSDATNISPEAVAKRTRSSAGAGRDAKRRRVRCRA